MTKLEIPSPKNPNFVELNNQELQDIEGGSIRKIIKIIVGVPTYPIVWLAK